MCLKFLQCEMLWSCFSFKGPMVPPAVFIVTINEILVYFRLWYIRDKEGSRSSVNGKPTPIEVGYMNVIPKCLNSQVKYPVFENLPETYAAINEYLSESPLEGRSLENGVQIGQEIQFANTSVVVNLYDVYVQGNLSTLCI